MESSEFEELVNEFIKYVVEGNISVVHLEREAVLLQAARGVLYSV